MEILFVGIAIVALMAYVSTRIKKSAADAYLRETIDAPEFALVKPEGFLNPIDAKEGLAFYAYSKDYGVEDSAKFRHSEIRIRVYESVNLKEIVKNLKSLAEKVVSEKNGNGAFLLKTENSEEKVYLEKDHKFISKNNKIYELEFKTLQENKEDYAERIAETFESFKIK
ncbi:MAG TPA: hypothetical protein PKY59_15150 [Pyrinomonadaceae bacterium]|nr:hypothetical protein [Pyrinomonadaceae bacterium]